MTAFVKIEGGVVVQKQPYAQAGFVEAPDSIVCGFLFSGGQFAAPPASEALPKSKLFKSTFVSRCTEHELTTLRARLATENIKFQEMYAACDFFLIEDPLFAVLHWTVSQLLGEPRADELLEMEL